MKEQFQTRKLSLEQKRQLLLRAKAMCETWWADKLDCKVSVLRQRIDVTFEEMMEKLDNSCHFTVIHRNFPPENHIEVAFSTMGMGPSYYLWINVGMEHAGLFATLRQ